MPPTTPTNNRRILFVAPPFSYGDIDALAPKTSRLGIAQLAACLRERGWPNVAILDFNALGVPPQKATAAILDFRPDFVGFTASTAEYPTVVRMAAAVKSQAPGVVCAVGGPHVTVMPETLDPSAFDYGVAGEGEEAIFDLLALCFEGEGDPNEIGGLVHFRDGAVKINAALPPIKDLDALPMPAHDLLPVRSYRPYAFSDRGRPFSSMIASRGCPFPCTFCTTAHLMGRKMRYRSVALVVDEMLWLKKQFGVTHIYFKDDEFTLNRRRLLSFCEEVSRRAPGTIWECIGRAPDIDAETAATMARAGCIGVALGAEFGYQEGLDRIKKQMKLEDTENAIRALRAAGVSSRASFMMGYPWEDAAKIGKTVDFALRTAADVIMFQLFTPWPGTDIYNEVKDAGLIVNRDWSQYIQHAIAGNQPAVRTQFLTDKQLKRLNQRALRRLLMSPSYWRRILMQIRTGRQLARIVEAVFALLKAMLSPARREGGGFELKPASEAR